MSRQQDDSHEFEILRKLAEERLGEFPGSGTSPDNLQRAIHELAVHRVELEMQNEELVKSRTELEKSLDRYKELYDFAPIGYITLASDGTIQQANLAAAGMLGVERSRLSGELIGNFVWVDDIPLIDDMLRVLMSGNRACISEVRLLRDDGRNPGPIQGDANNLPPRASLMTVRIDAVVSYDLHEFRITMIDISEQKTVEIENERLKASMSQVRRMESIGRLAGGVAHDFNNMLQVMLCNIEMMAMHEEARLYDPNRLSEMGQCIQRSANLVRQLLAFARSQPIRPEVIDLNNMVANLTNMLGRLLGENIRLSLTRSPEPLLVKMDPSQIDQILVNLAVNARDAIKGCGILNISLSSVSVDASTTMGTPEMAQGEYALLSISDNGCGIDPAIIDNIFEPFFSTKSMAVSSGLGLASVYGIVKQNNGFIRVSSKMGQGTRFEIYFALIPSEQSVEVPPDDSGEVPGGSERILFVEDHDRVRVRTAEFLERCGYTVYQAGSPEEAIRLFDASFMQIDLLITDMVMPSMSGKELSLRIAERNPELPCLFISGYTTIERVEDGEGSGNPLPLLCKPYSLSSLACTVRNILDTGKAMPAVEAG
ncbi:MAG: response regulator [Chlorobiaceae bacterium]|nr:response regulator [Chlorobiaceae bacterium]NTW73807.1 response regulator [Chlorobiaceae bacterium]